MNIAYLRHILQFTNLFIIVIKPPLPHLGCFIVAADPILYLCWALLMVYEAGECFVQCLKRCTVTNHVFQGSLFS